jgi:pimeloyl-ACP methyl ester carboxylesterase
VEQRTLDAIAAAKVKFSDPRELAKLERYHGNKARWVVDAWTDTWLSESFRDWSIVSDLPAVRCPLLAIHGDADEYGSIDFPTTFTSMVSGASQAQILSNCGHVPHRERESEVLRIVREFIERVPLP